MLRSRILETFWVSNSGNDSWRDFYFRSHILEGAKRGLKHRFLDGTKTGLNRWFTGKKVDSQVTDSGRNYEGSWASNIGRD